MKNIILNHHILILLSWFLFAFWGVVAREIKIPLPILLLIITFTGGIFTLLFKKNILKISKYAFIIATILVFDVLFLVYAFKSVKFATVITLHYFGPVIVILFSHIFLKESISKNDILVSIIGLFGVIVLFYNEIAIPGLDNYELYGFLAALLSSITLALNILYQRYYMTKQKNFINAVIQYNFFMALILILIIIPFWSVFFGLEYVKNSIVSLSSKDIWLAIVGGILIQGVAMIFFNSSVRYIKAKSISLMSYTEVFWVIIIGLIVYKENISFLQLFGMVLVWFSAYYGMISKNV